MPGSRKVCCPTVIASEATIKNQPPDIDIIMFQMRPGIENGTSSFQKRCQTLSWKLRETSSKSRGTVRSAWEKLKLIFHARLLKMAKIAAHSTPRMRPGNRAIKKV